MCSLVILKVHLTSIGCTEGWTPIFEVKPSDSEGTDNKQRLYLRWRTHNCSVT